MYSTVALFVAGFAAAVNAVTLPVGEFPEGNPFGFPEAGVNVEAGVATTVTWTPTTEGPVSIYYCAGPSTNCVTNFDAPIAVSIANSGSFVWTPSTALLPTNGQGYGLQLIVDGTGQYQYTPQFGVSNASVGPTVIVSSNTAAPTVPEGPVITQISDGQPQAPTPTPIVPITSAVSSWVPTGTGSIPSTIVQPSDGFTKPTSLATYTTGVTKPSYTPAPPSNSAGRVGAGMGAVFAVVLAAFAL